MAKKKAVRKKSTGLKTDTRVGDRPFPPTNVNPSILTREIVDNLTKVAALGTSLQNISYVNNILPTTFNLWLAEGRKNPDSLHGELFRGVAKAVAGSEVTALNSIRGFILGRPAKFEMKKTTTTEIDQNGKKTITEVEEQVCIQKEILPDLKAIEFFLSRRFRSQWGQEATTELILSGADENKDVTPKSINEARLRITHIAEQMKEILDDE